MSYRLHLTIVATVLAVFLLAVAITCSFPSYDQEKQDLKAYCAQLDMSRASYGTFIQCKELSQ